MVESRYFIVSVFNLERSTEDRMSHFRLILRSTATEEECLSVFTVCGEREEQREDDKKGRFDSLRHQGRNVAEMEPTRTPRDMLKFCL